MKKFYFSYTTFALIIFHFFSKKNALLFAATFSFLVVHHTANSQCVVQNTTSSSSIKIKKNNFAGQSITASCSGEINSVSFKVDDNDKFSGTLRIYKGYGIAGSYISVPVVKEKVGSNGYLTISLPSGYRVTQGEMYTLLLSSTKNLEPFINKNGYAGGTAFFDLDKGLGIMSAPALDLIFNIQIDKGCTSSSTTTTTACDSLVWNGQTYKTSGNYSKVFVGGNATGCDSTAKLQLTITHSTSSEETVSNCESFFWNGNTYYSSGDYTYMATNAANCDSTATLHLTIKTSVGITSVSAADNPVCGGTKTILTANGVTGTNAMVTWYDGPGGTGNVIGTGITSPLVDVGTYYAYVTGDCGTPVEASITLTGDVTNPEITCPNNVSVDNVNGCDKAVLLDAPIYSDNCKVKSLSWTLVGATNASSSLTGIRPITSKIFNNGTTTVTYTVRDFTDLSNSCSFSVTVNDKAKPVFSPVPSNIDVSIPKDCSTNISVPDVSFTDNCGTPDLSWSMSGANTGSGTGQVGTMNFNIGTTTLTYTLTDANNNVRFAIITVKVAETEPPSITCPGDITTSTIGTYCTKNIATTDPIFSDNCGVKSLTWSITGATNLSSPANGIWLAKTKKFNAGLSSVSYTLTDFSGNTASCSYAVQLNSTNTCSPTILSRSIVENETNNNDLRVRVSPNPTKSNFVLNIKSDSRAAIEIAVYNSEGKRIEQLKTANLNNIIFGEKYTYGTYLIELRQGEKRTTITGVKQ